MQQSVAITGLGVVSPIGLDVASVAASLREGRSGIRSVRVAPLERDFAAGVIDASFEDAFTKLELPFLDRCQQLAILAARQAVGDAGFDTFEGFGQRAGLYYGNVNGGVAAQQAWYQQMLLEGKQASRPFSAMAMSALNAFGLAPAQAGDGRAGVSFLEPYAIVYRESSGPPACNTD